SCVDRHCVTDTLAGVATTFAIESSLLPCSSKSWLTICSAYSTRAASTYIRSPVVRTASIFFFSSRRRHTRLVSDWSSDVCSSDLLYIQPQPVAAGHYVIVLARRNTELRDRVDGVLKARMRDGTLERIYRKWGIWDRSEERRVGKECRCRWGR